MRALERQLFEAFLSVQGDNTEDQKQFLSTICPFVSAKPVSKTLDCAGCELCHLQGFASEQDSLRPLVKSFCEGKSFTVEDVEALNRKLEGLLSPSVTWEYKDEELRRKEQESGWRQFKKTPQELTKEDVVILRGFRVKNALGMVYASFLLAIDIPIISLDSRDLTTQEIRKLAPRIQDYRHRIAQLYSLKMAGPGRPQGATADNAYMTSEMYTIYMSILQRNEAKGRKRMRRGSRYHGIYDEVGCIYEGLHRLGNHSISRATIKQLVQRGEKKWQRIRLIRDK